MAGTSKNWPARICLLFVVGSLANQEWLWAAAMLVAALVLERLADRREA